jgi:hypothetical protein
MKYAYLVVAVFAARFFATAIAYPQADGDLAWQRWLGETIIRTGAIPRSLGNETFSAPGAMWVPQEWLFSLGAAVARGAMWPLFAGTIALCATVALLLSAYRAKRRGASPMAVAIGTSLAAIAILESFGVRAQVAAWPFVVGFLALLEIDGPWAYAAIPLAALWSNVHASAMLAPVFAALWTIGSFADEGLSPTVRRSAIVAAGSLGAICLNPFGIGLPIYAISLFSSPFKNMITEWKHTDLGDPSFGYGSLPLLLAAAAFGVRGDGKWRDRLMLIAVAVLMFSAARNVGVFALAIMPIVAAALTREVPFLAMPRFDRTKTSADRFAGPAIPAFSIVMAILVTVGLLHNDARNEDNQPHAAIAALRALPGAHRVFCADFAWCSFIVEDGSGSVFLDGRADPYPLAVWNDFTTVVRLRPGWDRRLDARKVDTILVASDAPLEQGLRLSPDWKVAYHDKKYELWQRRGSFEIGAAQPPDAPPSPHSRAH